MSNEIFSATIRGIAPLIMHNGRLADPMDPASIELAKVSKGKAKDLAKTARAEFMGSLYLDEKQFPCIPVDLVLACMLAGARGHKIGKQFSAGVYDIPDQPSWPLSYKGPRTPEELYEDDTFRDRRSVRVQQARVIRTRPVFRKWGLTFSLEFDPSLISRGELETCLTRAGKAIGLGDYRPRFGRFVVEGVS